MPEFVFHQYQPWTQRSRRTIPPALSSTPELAKQTFSLTYWLYAVLPGLPHRLHCIWEELLLPCERGLPECSSRLSPLPASVLKLWEKVCLSIRSRLDSGCGGDTWVSRLCDTLFYIPNVRSVLIPHSDHIVSPPRHSSTGKARCFLLNS